MTYQVPNFDEQAFAKIAKEHYGLKGEIFSLVSYEDQNALIKTSKCKFVIKVANKRWDLEFVKMQTEVLEHLKNAAPDMTFPSVVTSLKGEKIIFVDGFAVRILTFLEGNILGNMKRSPELYHDIGCFLGQFSNAMRGFSHPGREGSDVLWKLDNVIECKAYLSDVIDEDTRDRITRLYKEYEKSIRPKLQNLRKAIIHGDANEQNFLILPDQPNKVAGLIDFGEMQYGTQINDLAIALAYSLLGEDDIQMAASNIIDGYTREFPLEEAEIDILYYLMAMRLVTNITMTSHSAKQHPDNKYILIAQKSARALLKKLEDEKYILRKLNNMTYREPWSKRHKSVTVNTPFNLSNSFAEPLESEELINLSLDRGDLDIVEQYHKHSLIYTPNGGSLDLREEIADLYGLHISAENIVIFPGAQVALQTAASALLDKNCHSIVFTPSYQSVQEAPARAGSQVTRICLHPETNWQINPEVVEAAVQKNTKYIVINEPHNPTGTLMSHNVQRQLKDIAEANDIYILSDEVYRLIEHNADDRLPAMADFYEKGISAVTLSKPWGGCGITIGWLALQDLNLRQKIIDTQYFGTACPSRASEIQAIMTLRASDKILEKNLKIIRHNIELLEQFIEKYSDLFDWVRPSAGAIAYVKFKGPLTSAELGEQLAKSGISIKPAYVFSEYGTEDSGYFRVGYGEKIMPRALEALSDYVEAHKETWCS